MRSKDIIKRIERLGGCDNVHPKTCKSIEIALAPCFGDGWLKGGR